LNFNRYRYQVQYELNRLSNIIEEEDYNYDEDASHSKTEEETRVTHKLETLSDDDSAADDTQSTVSELRAESGGHLDKASVRNLKEMLVLGEQISTAYSSISTELARPAVDYKPVMKKRVYHLNRAYASSEPQAKLVKTTTKTTTSTEEVSQATSRSEECYSSGAGLVSLSSATNSHSSVISNVEETTTTTSTTTPAAGTDTDEFGMLNFLLARLSEKQQQKAARKESGQIGEVEKELMAECGDEAVSCVVTKSVYAEKKRVEAGAEGGGKMITALSINEIQTRRSWCGEGELEGGAGAEVARGGDEVEESVKDEFVLIGERDQIDALLDNRNGQLYNLIMSNSSRSCKLSEIESNLNRVSGLPYAFLFGFNAQMIVFSFAFDTFIVSSLLLHASSVDLVLFLLNCYYCKVCSVF